MSEAADTVSDIASRGNPNSCPKVVDSSETIQSITKKVPGMIYQFQLFPDGRSFFPYASEGIHSIFEVTPEQVRETADPALLLVHSDDILEMFSSIRHSSATLEPWHYIFRVNLPVRGVRWVEGEATPERLPDGSTLWHGYMRDVTARKQLDLESIGKDRNFRTLIESSSDIIALLTPEGGLKYLNPAFEKVLGLRPEEWQNRTFHELIWPEDLGLAVDVFTQSLMSPRKVVHWQLRLHHANGGFLWLEGTGINHLEDPVIGAVLVNCRDIAERKKGEIALQESEERYRRAERGTNDGLWDWNMITDVVYRSPQWFKILGYEPGELKCDHLTTLDLVHAEDKAAVEKNLLDHFELGVPFCQELRLRTKSGDFRWVQSRGEVERDAQGKPVRMSGVYSDISARKHAEAEVINERNRLRQILDSQPTFFSLLTLDGIIQEVNQTPLKIIQRSLEDVVGLRFVEMACLDSESNAKAENAIQIAATGGTVHEDLLADLPGKGRRNMDATFYPLKDADGQVTGLVAFGMDVTERKKAEARVSQLNRIYAILSEINNDIIHEKDTAAMLTAACRIAVETGKLRMAWVGMFDAQSLTVKPVAIAGIDDGYVSQVNINLMDESRKGPAARCIQSGEYAISKDIQNDPCFVPWRDEALRRGYRSSGVFPLKVEGRVVGCFALYADTIDFFNKEELVLLSELAMNMGFALEVAQKEQDRQRIQSQLKESEARYKVLFDSAPDSVFLVAAEGEQAGQILACNDHGAKMHGYEPGELEGKSITFLDTPESGVHAADRLRRLRQGENLRFEVEHHRKDGTVFPIEVVAHRIFVQGRMCIIAFDRDISATKKAQKELRQLQRQYALILNSIAEGVYGIDLEGKIIFENPAAARMLGWDAMDMPGRSAFSTICRPSVNGQTREAAVGKLESTLKDGITRRVTDEVFWRKDGTSFPVEYFASPMLSESGVIEGVVVNFLDVTERKQLEERLRQSQKMEAVGTLAGGIAHDFNNILATLFGLTYLLQEDTRGNDEVQSSLAEIIKSLNRASDLVKQILTFSRQREQKREVILLETVVKEALKFLRASLPANILIETDFGSQSPSVLADSTQIYQVLMNLGTNALHAMEGMQGCLTVRLELFKPENAFLRTHPEFKKRPYAHLILSDTGHGMDARVLGRIFEPFFTTKEVGKGTGLGLAVVLGIVQSHEGHLNVESEVGRGTTFHIFLPAHSTDVFKAVDEITSVQKGDGQSILLVDDEPALALVFQRMLTRLGYKVSYAESPQEALRVFQGNAGCFDLMLTDMSMPGMTGLELAQQLQIFQPGMRILLISGFSPNVTMETLCEAGISELLEKPVSFQALAAAVHRVLHTK